MHRATLVIIIIIIQPLYLIASSILALMYAFVCPKANPANPPLESLSPFLSLNSIPLLNIRPWIPQFPNSTPAPVCCSWNLSAPAWSGTEFGRNLRFRGVWSRFESHSFIIPLITDELSGSWIGSGSWTPEGVWAAGFDTGGGLRDFSDKHGGFHLPAPRECPRYPQGHAGAPRKTVSSLLISMFTCYFSEHWFDFSIHGCSNLSIHF